jgi:protein O-mannosyl-transferase
VTLFGLSDNLGRNGDSPQNMICQQPPLNPSASATGRAERWLVPGLCVALTLIVFAVFGQTAGFGFVNFDDDLYVYDNTKVAGGLSLKGFAWVFTHADCSLYHPLTMLSLMADYQLHGLHAGGYHFTNVLLHTASVILLFLVLRQMTGALWRSAFVAAVFAIHPLRVESVAWVSERKDVLSAFFFMLTLGAYVRYARNPKSLACYLMVVVAFVLALLSKPTVVILPVVLLLLDYWPLNRFEQPRRLPRLILEKIPLLALAVGACAMTVLVAEKWIVPGVQVSVLSRIGNALVSYSAYLGQVVWPARLAVLYPYPEDGLPPWKVALTGTLLAIFSAVALWQRGKRPWLLLGWLWYLAMLAPMIGILQVGGFAHADRYTYLPQIGIYVAVTWLLAEWGAKLKLSRGALGGIMTAVIALLMAGAWKQTGYWRDSITLWSHTLACTARNEIAHHNLGSALLQKGLVDEGIAQYRIALQLKPSSAKAHYSLASALMQKGNVDEALTQFMYALQIDPKDAEIHTTFGRALLRKGKVQEAAAHFQQALLLKPDSARAHFDLANLFLDQGRVDDAIIHYQQALQIDPDDAEVQNSLGSALLRNGRVEEAAALFQQALQLKPDFAQAHYNLGNILLQNGKTDEAITHYKHALQIDPDYALAHVNLGSALLQKGNVDDAFLHFQRALQIDPDNVPAHVNLGGILLQRGKVDDAIAHFRKALQIKPGFAEAHSRLGDALRQKGNFRDAIAQFQQSLQIEPNDPEVQNNLAWLLATCLEASLRDGGEAVQLAQRANELAGGRNPAILRTLAAAYAETGRFYDAKRSAKAAIELVQAARQQDLANMLNAELKRYEAGLPVHE